MGLRDGQALTVFFAKKPFKYSTFTGRQQQASQDLAGK